MKKSVYSLVLSDEVVKEADNLAYKLNKNRSGIINEILAEYLSLTTPEVRIKQILKSLEDSIKLFPEFKIQPAAADSVFIVKSALRYKYNPVIKYNVALFKNNRHCFGSIKAGIRTQNGELISAMNDFFKLFSETEKRLLDFHGQKLHEFSNGYLLRKFLIGADDENADEVIGKSVSAYIDNLDSMTKRYFDCILNGVSPRADMVKMYENYLKHADVIL